MGKKRAAKLASLQVNKETLQSAKVEVEALNKVVENLKTLLNRTTDKASALEQELVELKAQVSQTKKTATKKRTNKKAKTTVAETTED